MNIRLNISKTIRPTMKSIISFLFWLTYFIPPCIERISGMTGTLGELMCYVFFALLFLGNFRGKYFISRFHIALLVFMMWCTMCVALASFGSLPHFLLKTLIPTVMILVTVDLSVQRDGIRGMKPLYYVCCIYMTLNFISMLLFPKGLFQSDIGSSVARAQWVFGSKNNLPLFMVTFLTIIAAYEFLKIREKKNKKSYFWIYAVMAGYSVLFSGGNGTEMLAGSSTGIIAIALCIMGFICLIRFKNILHVFTPINTIIGTLIVNFFLIGGTTLPIITQLITKVFKKGMTFSGRTSIWLANLTHIPASPIFGYGMNSFYAPVYTAGVLTTTKYTYNMCIKYMLSYGVVSLFLLSIMLLCIRKTKATLIQILNVGLIGIIIIGTMNEISVNNFMLFPIIMSAISNFVCLDDEEMVDYEHRKTLR